ncbi:5-amino-6-(5-phosphoribosylamino)uracil reductase [Candidatus Methylomirabilis lanthanidiphila]|uniref:Riboflavin biosynthesis protein RibD n=1 Tax=Candidatus Methylomirabilis lanthanidiphila TaxID=2211376 RepID=A0A564ZII6_9BACT|nr:bifunctional diaminohydroxyphosphoribosylaminopyrimidine deaminase/5-amino-6-(5-phosphoribosylamino)uracil reductase RibD [Candidatus Methylomirabilis lanthanidiphila]VUZ84348.1 5-amino-6-(5-phosphoribosylamino)uracil reductase [Candidatus Methylomirabilis lanthanidiphila]
MFTPNDVRFMQRAMALAVKGRGRTSPNPMVGAVVVQHDRIVGEGYHARAGEPHAEVIALEEAAVAARGADLYVTLEPCCHYGRTPPCTDLIVQAGIRRVVLPIMDPNPLVSGKGAQTLRDTGIMISELGLFAEQAMRLNEAFTKFITCRTPFVILKAAVSLDGKIATRTGDARWISGERSRERVHALRDQVDAVIVGIGTVRRDNPRLTTRLPGGGRDPIRVIVDGRSPLPLDAQVLQSGSGSATWVAVAADTPAERIRALERRGLKVLEVSGSHGRVCLEHLLKRLGECDVTSVMIEGGEGIFTSAIEERIVDKFLLFVAPMFVGGKTAPSLLGGAGIESIGQAQRLSRLRIEQLGEDLLVEGYRPTHEGAC